MTGSLPFGLPRIWFKRVSHHVIYLITFIGVKVHAAAKLTKQRQFLQVENYSLDSSPLLIES